MANLISELGRPYFNERFGNSFFKGPNGHPCYVMRSERTAVIETPEIVRAVEVKGSLSKPTVDEIEIPADFFSSMEVFAVPELGWRMAAKGKYLARFERNNRSYHRGVAFSNLIRSHHDMTLWAADEGIISLEHYTRHANTVKLVMEPEYMPLSEGIKEMAQGKLLSFAVSANLAVVPDLDDKFALLFGYNKVGTITPEGEIDCEIPLIGQSYEEEV